MMRQPWKTIVLLLVCVLCCLVLTGCEDQDARIQQALIDMGYMSPAETPAADESAQPEPSNPASASSDAPALPLSPTPPASSDATEHHPHPTLPPLPDLPDLPEMPDLPGLGDLFPPPQTRTDL